MQVVQAGSGGGGRNQNVDIKLTNTSTPQYTIPGVIDSRSVIDTNLLIVVQGLNRKIRLVNASGRTSGGDPYVRVFLPNGVLTAGQSMSQTLQFQAGPGATPPNYTLKFLSGQGNP